MTAAWFDQVLAAPTVGVLLQPWFGFSQGVWSAIEVLSERWSKVSTLASFKPRNAMAMRIDLANGIYFDLEPHNFVCGYTYNATLRTRPGDLPELIPPSRAKSYSEILTQVLEHMQELLTLTVWPNSRKLVRIGVLADCRLVASEAPPGIASYVEHLGNPWPNRLRTVESTALIELNEVGGVRDQCHHSVSVNAYDRPDDLRFKLDYQRVFEPNLAIDKAQLIKKISECGTIATDYFDQFGSGAWNDESDSDGPSLD